MNDLHMHKLQQLKRDNWPSLINDIAEMIGDEFAMSLFIKFAGRHFCVPITCPPGHVLESIIGAEKAKLFCKNFGGESLTFPNGRLLLIKERNRKIVAEYNKGGMTQGELATKYQLSERHIVTIVSGSNKARNNEM